MIIAVTYCLFNIGTALHYGTIKPAHQVVYENSIVQINCVSNGRKHWTKNDERLVTEVYGENIRIMTATAKHIGVYVCQGSLDMGRSFTATSTLLVGGNKVILTGLWINVPLLRHQRLSALVNF